MVADRLGDKVYAGLAGTKIHPLLLVNVHTNSNSLVNAFPLAIFGVKLSRYIVIVNLMATDLNCIAELPYKSIRSPADFISALCGGG